MTLFQNADMHNLVDWCPAYYSFCTKWCFVNHFWPLFIESPFYKKVVKAPRASWKKGEIEAFFQEHGQPPSMGTKTQMMSVGERRGIRRGKGTEKVGASCSSSPHLGCSRTGHSYVILYPSYFKLQPSRTGSFILYTSICKLGRESYTGHATASDKIPVRNQSIPIWTKEKGECNKVSADKQLDKKVEPNVSFFLLRMPFQQRYKVRSSQRSSLFRLAVE